MLLQIRKMFTFCSLFGLCSLISRLKLQPQLLFAVVIQRWLHYFTEFHEVRGCMNLSRSRD
jgi:hypothetical protein